MSAVLGVVLAGENSKALVFVVCVNVSGCVGVNIRETVFFVSCVLFSRA